MSNLPRPQLDEYLLDALDVCSEQELAEVATRAVIALLDVALPRENSIAKPEKISRRALANIWFDLRLGELPPELRKVQRNDRRGRHQWEKHYE